MTTLALLNVFSYVYRHDFTGDTNQANLSMEAAALDRTTFRSDGWTELTGGLKSSEFELQGFWQAAADGDAVDNEGFNDLGVKDRVHTMGPRETEQGVAYMWRAGRFSYQALSGSIGELAGFTLGSQGSDSVGVVRGQLAAAKQDVSVTGQLGSTLDLGNADGDQFVYAALHVFTVGTSITVDLERDDNTAFDSPITVATLNGGPITSVGGFWLRQATSASTDNFYRLNVTAITGTFNVAGAIGVQ